MKELFDGLTNLCATNEAFYFSDQELGTNIIIRSFSYRLASYTDFQLPFALDCRGTSFWYDKKEDKWTLFSRAFKKFFNLGEGIPKDVYIANNKPIHSFEKVDGSIIMVGRINGELISKSKTSINSVHAMTAQKLINSNEKLKKFCNYEISNNRTPIFELVGSGELRIVLSYGETSLIYLSSICNTDYALHNMVLESGEESFEEIAGVRCAKLNNFTWDELIKIQETSKPIIEGFVVQTESGLVKCKVQSYVNLHHTKDNVNNLKNLIQLVLEDNLDDLIGMFQDDPETINYITNIQDQVGHLFNHLVGQSIELHNKYFNEFNQDRKEFALQYKNHKLFGIVMKSLKSTNIESITEKLVKEYIFSKTSSDKIATEFLNSK